MKNMNKKGTVHPTPPFISHQLSFLPSVIFTLTIALPPDDREVLAYLISSSSNDYTNIMNMKSKKRKNGTSSSSRGCYSSGVDHATCFNCSCFRCYMSFWVRWDGSPNRQLIHDIIDAYEDGLSHQVKKEKRKKGRRKKGDRSRDDKGVVGSKELSPVTSELKLVKEEYGESSIAVGDQSSGGEVSDKGSIRRFFSFVGQKIWGLCVNFVNYSATL